jgi:hypothetical protein
MVSGASLISQKDNSSRGRKKAPHPGSGTLLYLLASDQ